VTACHGDPGCETRRTATQSGEQMANRARRAAHRTACWWMMIHRLRYIAYRTDLVGRGPALHLHVLNSGGWLPDDQRCQHYRSGSIRMKKQRTIVIERGWRSTSKGEGCQHRLTSTFSFEIHRKKNYMSSNNIF
jgi:hypothetical protein